MPESEIECRVRLTHSDFIMANHRVHGVSVLPGVTFLDIIYRVLIAQGHDPRRVVLRNVLFTEAVTTSEGLERELRVVVGAPEEDVRRVRVESRWLRDGVEIAPWRENARAELVPDDREPAPARDVTALIAAAAERDDVDRLYARTRREGIRHGAPMTCSGVLYRPSAGAGAPRWLLAELRLDPSVTAHEAAFHLHPAMMDASTLAAFGQNEDVGAEPFIPFFIERFRAPAPLRGTVYAHVPAPEVPVGSGDLLRNSYTLHSADGELLAEFHGMSCKRIRHPELITKLLAEVDPAQVVAPEAAPLDTVPGGPDPVDLPDDPVTAVVAHLRARIAAVLDRPDTELRTDLGFYDLGLDSVTLLNLSAELETLAGTALYPTLLFEYGTIDSLARHLVDTYPIRLRPQRTGVPAADDAEPSRPDDRPPSAVREDAAVTACLTPEWVAGPSNGGPAPTLVVAIDAPSHVIAELGRATRVRAVESDAPATAGPEAVAVTEQRLAEILAEIADEPGPVAFLQFLPTAPADAPLPAAPARLLALARALVATRPTRPIPVVCVTSAPAGPQQTAVGALAATIAAEVPSLRCRLVEATGAVDPGLLLAELCDDRGDPVVRHVAGTRQVRRWRNLRPIPPTTPAVRRGGVYLVTGGGGGIAGLLTEHLVATYGAKVILIGRGAADQNLRDRMADWNRRGGEVHYVRADVAQPSEVRAAVATAQGLFGRINGVLHCAGSVRDGLFFRKDPTDLVPVWAAKVAGTVQLDEATRELPLDFFALFSSMSALVPNPGQSDYAYANAFQFDYARWRATTDRPGRSVAIAWPYWAEGGMRIPSDALARSSSATGAVPLPTADALRVLEWALAEGPPDVAVVCTQDPARIADLLPPAPVSEPAAPTPSGAPGSTGGPGESQAIAVIGLAGRYPQAADLDEFWRNLTEGRDCIREVPIERWDHDAIFDPNRDATGRTYSRWGGFVDGVDLFDPGFFGISRRDAQRMDPQERLFLLASWHAVEDAGYNVQALAGETVGVFAGVMWNHYQLLADQDGGVAPTAMHAAVANRVSYCLNLNGPSMAVDSACSASLTAVHLAVESLRRGESTLALAGGVNVTVHPQKYLQLAQGQFLSDDGRCRSFGADASGYVPGEGVGVVVLKPLDRALADGDHIYGVIRASVLNHTGRTSGFTVPSPTAQAELIRAALDQAGWTAGSVGVLEAHGTGTSLGDPIEIEGLRQAFAKDPTSEGGCAVGSVKSNIGHLESAAGIAGLTKVLLQLRYRELVPSLHSTRINPHLDLAGSPLRVQQRHEPWPPPPGGGPRRAGVSAFGAGGANGHILVEEAPAGSRPALASAERLFVLSARNEATLRRYAENYLDLIDGWLAEAVAGSGTGCESVPGLVRLTELAADVLGIPVSAIDGSESLSDLGFDPPALAELLRRAGVPSARIPVGAEPTIAELAELLDTRAGTGRAEPPDRFAELTYTLQVGRVPMATRLAIVAGSLRELREELAGYLAGQGSSAGRVYHGPANPRFGSAHERLAAFRAGRLAEVAEDWVAGGELAFADAYDPDSRPRRIPLPGYPFQLESCWVGQGRPGGRAARAEETRLVAATPAAAVGPAPRVLPDEPVPTVPVPFDNTDEVELRLLDGAIALVTLRDRDNNNMFTPGLMRGLEAVFAHLSGRTDIGAVVLTGVDSVFSMGATPSALETLAGGGSRFTDSPFVYEGLLRCPHPVITAMQGHASGGGLAFGLYADVVVMARESSYRANFLTYGFTPGMGATYILERRFGRALAAEMFYTGRSVTGAELERRGANVSFADQRDVLPTALGLARAMAEKAPHAVRVLKRDLASRVLAELAEVIDRESAMHDRVFGPDSVDRIRDHFRKVDAFRSAAQPPQAGPAVVSAATAPTDRAPSADPGTASADQASPAVPTADQVTAVLTEVLCASLYLDPSEVDPELPFSEMGLDSIGAVEVVRELNRAFGLDIDSVAVYDHPTVRQLVTQVRAVAASRAELYQQAVAPPADPRPEPEPVVPADPHPKPEPVTPELPASPAEPPGGESPPPSVRLAPVAGKATTTDLAVDRPGARVSLRVLSEPSAQTESRPAADDEPVPIAVIGMAGRFPDAPDLDGFWRNLLSGRDSVRTVPASRWDVETYFDPDRRVPGRTYSKWAALLSDVDAFDPAFFRISPLEATAMDPQQRLFLQVAWAGIEDAGYAEPAAGPRRWGVFVGCDTGEYVDLLRETGQSESAHAFLGNSASVLAARIAYLLDLTGPTMAVDTACSSSLVAVHLACESIRSGGCDAAVAGGVALMLTPRMHVMTSKTGMLSPTGRSAPFAAAADGIVLGEGVGAVVLKRLDRALADGDQVHGVILASGINGDGRTNGLTAPSAVSQAALIREVHRRAGVSASDITYVEAHGTGTPLGDPIEVKALDQVLRAGVADGGTGFCGIGSVKSNIGHTTMAAGVAGLLKTLLALRHRKLPPTINLDEVNPRIDFDGSALRPVTTVEDWRPGPSGRLVAAVSSFGFSGTNAHLVVAEPPHRESAPGHAGEQAIVLSARTPSALARVMSRLADRLQDPVDRPALVDVAYTLAVGRAALPVRAATVVGTVDELLDWLRQEAIGAVATPTAPDAVPSERPATPAAAVSAWLAGRSVDWSALPNLRGGRRIGLPTYPFDTDRHWVDVAAEAPAEPTRTADVAGATRSEADSGPGATVRPTDWLVADHRVGGTPLLPGVAVLEAVVRAVTSPAAAGTDLNTPTGITDPLRIAGVQWLRPFTVTSPRTPRLDLTPYRDALRFTLTAADEPEQVVAQGRVLRDVGDRIESEVVELDTVRERCTGRIDSAEIYAGFTVAGISYGPSFQVLDEVRYTDDEALGVLAVPPSRAAEIAVRPLHPVVLDGALQTVAALVGRTDTRPYVPFALEAVDVLAPVPVAGYSYVTRRDGTFTVRLTDLDGRVCVRFTGLALRVARTAPVSDDGPTRLFVPVLRAASPFPPDPSRRRVVVLSNPSDTALAAALVAEHRAAGDRAMLADLPETADPGWVDRLDHPDTVYLLAVGTGDQVSAGDAERIMLTGYRVLRSLALSELSRQPLTVKIITGGVVPAVGTPVRPAAAGLLGLARSVAAEQPHWTVGCLDVGVGVRDHAALAAALRAEPGRQRLVLLDGDRRMTRVLRPVPADPPSVAADPYREQGSYLLIGGAGGIGAELARHLARTRQARLTLVGRRPADERIDTLLAELRRLGGQASYLRADASRPDELRAAVARARAEFGDLHGVFHTALVLRDRTVARMTENDLRDVLAAKVAGAVALGTVLQGMPLDFLVFFSSAVSFTDAAGQANYAAASTFEDAYAAWLRDTCRLPVCVVNWGFWGTVGVVADNRYVSRLDRFGVGSIEPHEGLAALAEVLRRRLPQAVVVKAQPDGLARLGVETETALPEPGGADTPVDRVRRAFPLLERFAPALLHQTLTTRGVLASSGGRTTVRELRERIGVQPQYHRLFAALVDMLVESGRLRRDEGGEDVLTGGRAADTADPADIVARYPELAPHVTLLTRCVEALLEVLAGVRRPTEVLFPGGSSDLVEQIYRGQAAADFYHRLMADEAVAAVRRARRDERPVRILEVGAGTGASSVFVLAALAESGVPVEYCYTDISSAFLRRGTDAFADRYPFLTFATLDIERDPAAQGFTPHSYDLVLATNVLHATTRIDHTLAQVRRLLRADGTLLVNEVTAGSHFLTLTFGLTPGWWKFQDEGDRLPHSPLLAPRQWWDALTAAGFSAPRTLGFPDVAPAQLGQCLLAATVAQPESGSAVPDPKNAAAEAVAPAAVRGYVRSVFAEVLRFRADDLADQVTFENYGVDSLVSLDILSRFEADLGPLPATLLFEHLTIAELAEHLLAEHRERLAAVLVDAAADEAPAPPRVAALDVPVAEAQPVVSVAVRQAEASDAGPTGDDIERTGVAVIGVVGRYPGAPDLDRFWGLLAEGRSGVTEVPAHRWDWRDHFDPRPGVPQRSYGKWGGFLDGIDEFDPGFFGILPREAADIDPQERLFLECAWRLLEQAGYLGEHTHEPATGVFVGTMYGSYGQLAAAGWHRGELSGAHSAYWSIANRVSYVLNLRGPSFAVDSACSSSLLAVHLASESIRRGECRMAIAGGVNVILHPAHLVALSARNMLAADGRCKVFDAAADGFVPGEGVGAVLLKPLSQAIADGDRIWAVLRSGTTNAGGKTGGYTVPNPNAQAELVAEAVRRAGVDPGTIGYLEAHGTGTELGDPIEITGLRRVFSGPAPTSCAIGSVKANIGHLEGAAGIAGLTKVLLQLRHGRIAPCVNLDTVNPKIELDPERHYLPRTLTEWPRPVDDLGRPMPRRAGVSSFGAGGANVHLIVEEHLGASVPAAAPVGPAGRIFVLSARTRPQLVRYAAEVADFLADPGAAQVSLVELCCAAQLGRRQLPERLAVVADDVPGLARALREFASGSAGSRCRSGTATPGNRDADIVLPASTASIEELSAIAEHWVAGGPVDWRSWWPARLPARADFPGCPFERRRYWLSTPTGDSRPAGPADEASSTAAGAADALLATGAEVDCVFRRPVWRTAPLTAGPRRPRSALVIVADQALADALVAELADRDVSCRIAQPVPGVPVGRVGPGRYRFDPSTGTGCAELVELLAAEGPTPDTVLQVAAPGDDVLAQLDAVLYPYIELVCALLAVDRTDRPLRAVAAVADGAIAASATAGAIRTLAREHSRFTGWTVTLPPAPVADQARLLAGELSSEPTETEDGPVTEVAYFDGIRRVKILQEFTPAPESGGPGILPRPGGSYLITGGGGALGLAVAEFLAHRGAGRLVLAARSEPTGPALARIAALRAAGTDVCFHRADVSSPEDVAALLSACGQLHGIVHAAGISRDRRAMLKSREEMAQVLAPKVRGALLLDRATRDLPLDFLVLFSSLVAETGNPGQVDYSAANAALHAFAAQREELRRRGERSGRTLAIGWPLWADGGMGVDEATRRLFARVFGMVPMPTATGLSVLARGLAGRESSFVVWATSRRNPDVGRAPVEPAVTGPDEADGATVPGSAGARGRRSSEPTSPDLLRGHVERTLCRFASAFLLIDESEVDLTDDLLDTGFDSISLTELINQVNEAYGLDLLPTVLFECATLAAFADYLVREHAEAVVRTLPESEMPEEHGPDAVDHVLAEQDAATAEQAPAPTPPAPTQPTRTAAASDRSDPVAVVGMAGLLPNAADLGVFWEHLVAGADLIGPAPADRLELHADPETSDVRGGFVAELSGFDAALFRISRTEARLMDPQQRIFLETVWRAIEDAGHRPEKLAGTDTGLFVGVSTTDYADLLRQHGIAVEAHTASGIAHSILANRVSHVLDLRGPSEAVDTACSSSLVALHRAVRAITSGDCSAAVVGGVNALLSPGLFTAFRKSGMLSPDGACKTFDANADGYVRGEGAGALFLKPLARAEADGDHIYAVIRGVAVNHGGRSSSLTAPNPQAQARVLVQAYREAGVDPATVTAIEAHGTGTRLGDPVEIEGLKKAFDRLYADWGRPMPDQPHIALGSVKSNIGHLEAAAGIAGVLKVLLAMRYGVLPASINLDTLNPYLRLAGTPFFVNTAARDWTPVDDDGRLIRRAGVSSFGFGGVNAHVVLETTVRPPTRTPVQAGPYVLPLSAPDGPALAGYAGRLARYLADHPDLDLAAVAYTLQVGRTPRPHRVAVWASTVDEAVRALAAIEAGRDEPGVPRSADERSGPSPVTGWLDGADVDWGELWSGVLPRRVPLPPAPLARRDYWFDARAEKPRKEPAVPEPAAPDHPGSNRPSPSPNGRTRPKLTLRPTSQHRAPASAPTVAVASTPVEPEPAAASTGAEGVPGDRTELGGYIRSQVADILGLDVTEVASTASFTDLGLDSIFRMDLARRINAAVGVELDASLLYEYDTVERLAAHVAARTEPPTPGAAVTPPDGKSVTVVDPDDAVVTAADSDDAAERLFVELVGAVVARPFDPALDFVTNGFTSFDMLRVVSALERRFGALRKTLLFDEPTAARVVAHLRGAYGAATVRELLRQAIDEAESADRSAPVTLVEAGPEHRTGRDTAGPVLARKRQLTAELTALLQQIDERHAKEGGLAGRDIAPLVFLGSSRRAYFNFSRRNRDLLAWSYAGSAEDFPVLAGELLNYAAENGLRANFLSLLPLREAAGIPLTATPFGAVQRLEDLPSFAISGGKMTRLRYMVRRFAKVGHCRTQEYAPGTDSALDARIAEMIDQWGDQKQMVNPYVAVVREELRRGVLAERHRMFLTWRDDQLMNVVIVTKIPSENGYLLDLEFYPKHMPTGGLEFAIVSIIETLRDEGCTVFSFGASFGVQIATSDNAAPDVEQGLAELRAANIFGTGNFQFKNKFRPVNHPIYLCQPAVGERTGVSDVILMIADPDLAADVPGLAAAGSVAADSASPAPSPRPTPSPRPAPPTRSTPPAPAVRAVPAAGERTRRLADRGWNPLALAPSDIEVDLVTDSWAELSGPALQARASHLRQRAADTDVVEFSVPDWLPFDLAVPTASGRSAEALLCRAWPGPRGLVIHSGLFPTWSMNLADAGFGDRRVRTVGESGGVFRGDVDLADLRAQLARANGGTAFVAVELSGNAGGGQPVSIANLRAVRQAAAVHRVPVVLDATRLVENAVFIARHEPEFIGLDPWTVARELLDCADAVTLSLSKDFGVTFGGLVATRIPELADRIREHLVLRGREVGLTGRRRLAAALTDRRGVLDLVETRMSAVAALWSALHEAGVPMAAPTGAHCVLLDVNRMPRFARLTEPVASFLAWLYLGTGVRGGPHHTADGVIRLAVPLGLSVDAARAIGARIAELWRLDAPVPDLLAVDQATTGTPPQARYHPAEGLPEDISAAMREGYRPQDENAQVLREEAGVQRRLVEVDADRVEVFIHGEGPVLLLMHPFNIGAGVFARQFADLAARFRVVTVHHPGVGATTWQANLTLDGIAALYADVLDRLGLPGPVHVAGASFGGLVAQTFALRYPDRTATLTLLGSSYKVGNRNGEVNRLSIVAAEDFDRVVAAGGLPAVRRADLEPLLLRCESMDPQTGLSYLDVFAAQPNLLGRLGEISVPTLILQGGQDTVIPRKTAHLLHGMIPDARYVELPHAGHFPTLTHPDEVHAELVPFLLAHPVLPGAAPEPETAPGPAPGDAQVPAVLTARGW
ncbi:MAG TPA: SDR family NAD(P)-dependent oxidoreductase [Micromonosporaceae bacterium]